jgi:hypothetical protein
MKRLIPIVLGMCCVAEKAPIISLCHNQSKILMLQREQIRRARLIVFGEDFYGYLSASENLELYRHSYGKYTIDLRRNSYGYTKLVYHRIYKCANDHLRTLLYNFAIYKYDKSRLVESSDKLLKCLPSCMIPPQRNQIDFDWIFGSFFDSPKNISFTFIREPMARFISGMTEVYTVGKFFLLFNMLSLVLYIRLNIG